MSSFQSFKTCSALVVVLAITGVPTFAAAKQDVFKVQVVADEMCCKGCARKVAAQLYAAPGVTSVEADVASHLITVTAKQSPNLTLERIWHAVEQGKGGPSKLTTSQATYVWTRAESLKPEQRLPAGRYSLEVSSMQEKESAQKIADQLYATRGVQNVSVDIAQRTLFIQPANGAVLSPWALASAAERAQSEPIAVAGPHGVLTIEWSAGADRTTAARATYPQVQGGNR
jgi:copper chaperone CopZ